MITKRKKLGLTIIFLFVFSVACFSQSSSKGVAKLLQQNVLPVQTAKMSAAYAEILLQKTEFEAQLEELLIGFTEDFPKVKELRFQLGLIQKQTDKLLSVKSADAGKLTLALGKLIVRRIELETEHWKLKAQYNDDFSEVKRAKRKVEVFDKAISEILP